MVDFSKWALQDPIRICDVAYLWVGADPTVPPFRNPERIWRGIASKLLMLNSAVASKRLRADTTLCNPRNHPKLVGNFELALVTRTDLIAFAKTQNDYPEFLFGKGTSKRDGSPRKSRSKPTQDDIREAILSISGPRIEAATGANLNSINIWLRSKGRPPVSLKSLQRYFKTA